MVQPCMQFTSAGANTLHTSVHTHMYNVENGIKHVLKMVRNNTEIDAKRAPAGGPQKGIV